MQNSNTISNVIDSFSWRQRAYLGQTLKTKKRALSLLSYVQNVGELQTLGAIVNVNRFFGGGKWETVISCYLERNIRKSLVQPLRQGAIG